MNQQVHHCLDISKQCNQTVTLVIKIIILLKNLSKAAMVPSDLNVYNPPTTLIAPCYETKGMMLRLPSALLLSISRPPVTITLTDCAQ